MELSVDASSFTTYWLNMLFALYTTSTTLLLYGLYVPLFTWSVRILRRRNPGEKTALLVTTYIMLLLGTLQTILWLCTAGISVRMTQVLVEKDAVDSLSRLWRLYFTLDIAQNIVFVTNNCVTDMLFLYRCYIIWGSRWKVTATPALCILSTVKSNIFLGVTVGLGQQVVNIAPTLIIVRVGLGDPVPNTRVISSKLVFQSTPLDILTSTRPPDSSQGIDVRATNSQVFKGSSDVPSSILANESEC
ncbi:hypothetical protein DFH08DRAFT_1087972 [Mycena albidolilacea]|uniref:Uncharacterized protein n=1 Tax=Mycena albidolilacea TaxID=1033008 RepID=A0AAD6Z7J8_9AGAR|nr:hypothetical protein DFH08DRAFT_1087972 [Mycena albidolilacea]